MTLPFTDEAWARARCARRAGRSRPRRAGRAPDHGRRADLRLDRRSRRAGMEHRRRRPTEASRAPKNWSTACASASRRAASCISARASGIPARACRAGRFRSIWRKDGEPIWSDPALIATSTRRTRGETPTPRAFAARSPSGSGSPAAIVQPAFEDANYWLVREGELPFNVDPLDPKLEDPEERARLVPRVRARPRQPPAIVLPVQRWNAGAEPHMAQRALAVAARQALLVPGDSPVACACRSSLPWVPPSAYPQIFALDPDRSSAAPLPDRRRISGDAPPRATIPQGAQDIVRRGACARRSRSRRATACSTSSCRRPTARGLSRPARRPSRRRASARTRRCASKAIRRRPIRGSTSQGDARPRRHRGQPASRRKLARGGRHHHDALRGGAAARLGAEKFMLDGRHAGTGGGNHVVARRRDAANTPFLRRPDLLRASCSIGRTTRRCRYLFSGLFIGPTSQAPRSTRRATISCTSLKSPSRRCRRPAPTRRCGSSTGCSATC